MIGVSCTCRSSPFAIVTSIEAAEAAQRLHRSGRQPHGGEVDYGLKPMAMVPLSSASLTLADLDAALIAEFRRRDW